MNKEQKRILDLAKRLDECCETLDAKAEDCKRIAPTGRERGDEMGCRPLLNEFCPASLKLL